MASKTASPLVKSSPAAPLQQEQNAPTPAAAVGTTAEATNTTPPSSNSNKSKADPSTRPRRGSSDDFAPNGSLGSIAGSAVGYGSSLEYSLSGITGPASSSHGSNPKKSSLSPTKMSPRISPRMSPSGRRPFRKRKSSVDFSFPALPMDDTDSGHSVSQLLPQHKASGSLTLPAPSNRNRLYSDLTIPESLVNSTAKNSHNSSSSSKQLPRTTKQNAKQFPQDRKDDQSQERILPSMDALPAMGDDVLPPIDDDPHSILLSHPESIISNVNQLPHSNPVKRDRGMSFASIRTEGQGLDRLDSLGLEATISASRIRKGSSVTSNKSKESKDSDGDGTLGSQSHRFLMEAFLGDGTESLVLNPTQRERLGSFDAAAEVMGKSHGSNSKDNHVSNQNNSSAMMSRDRLNSIGVRRNRLESWGGMSDMSVGTLKADQNLESLGVGIFSNGGSTNASKDSGSGAAAAAAAAANEKTAALAATIYTSLANDVTAAAAGDGNDSVSSFLVSEERIPTRISVNRDRLNSIASLGDASAILRLSGIDSSTLDAEFPSDVHSFVQAAMASVGDQLADLATAVEAVSKDNKEDIESEISSTASPMIGAASDVGSHSMDSVTGRPRSSSMSSMLAIAVDYDAVAAAVDAAEAAAGALDLSSFMPPGLAGISSNASDGSNSQRNRKKRPLPSQKKPTRVVKKKTPAKKKDSPKTAKSRIKKRAAAAEALSAAKRPCVASAKKKVELMVPDIPKSKMDDRDMEKLRERARAAAGYVPPSGNGSVKVTSLPPKKRSAAPATPSHPPRPSTVTSGSNFKTPIASNTSAKYNTPASGYSTATTPASSGKGQSSQKWESMFDCLLKFIEQRKKDGTSGMTEAQKAEWAWDGNVPTTYKTKDGKALGRWVNNQRSAKSKGTLKNEREKRLVDAGLKWSVLASNSWNEMLEELRIYVADQVQQGKKWDGNVPTNYRIKVSRDKSKPFGKDDDEDKNLGRWVNRQRSMFQAGKLRKDRQLSLEKIGLKWSMLATTSWESMFETLCQYVAGKRKGGNEWDGNVPANYRTEDIPPRALGRWINRQRSAYGKSKLKPEYVAKLNEIGLKWSIHERRPTYHQYARPDAAPSSARKATPSVTMPRTQNTSPKPVPLGVPSAATPVTPAVKKPLSTIVEVTTQPVKSAATTTAATASTQPLKSAVPTNLAAVTKSPAIPATAAAAAVSLEPVKAAVPVATPAVKTQPVETEIPTAAAAVEPTKDTSAPPAAPTEPQQDEKKADPEDPSTVAK
eukprot:CAMPEP_0116078032 /NCGR_PEP_ID=MMETSP0327-20121206/385_1 /TAXON_ID=44447 /ORGANISM="Pseudo-nitzschia delicatissima, Strain B596" /LENGTH=1264 /DNA_ID=CAMNT_0003568549 /DNA_START=103 /DNA_END=3898 /DNA_ORIENTATION=-